MRERRERREKEGERQESIPHTVGRRVVGPRWVAFRAERPRRDSHANRFSRVYSWEWSWEGPQAATRANRAKAIHESQCPSSLSLSLSLSLCSSLLSLFRPPKPEEKVPKQKHNLRSLSSLSIRADSVEQPSSKVSASNEAINKSRPA